VKRRQIVPLIIARNLPFTTLICGETRCRFTPDWPSSARVAPRAAREAASGVVRRA
jgi:hypothetical protein